MKIARGTLSLGLIALITFVMLEAALRIYPRVIPIAFLKDFNPAIRADIARRLGLPLKSEAGLIEDVETGEKFKLTSPNTLIRHINDEIDLRQGAVDSYRTDRWGFCNTPETASADHFKALAVGDSFTACTSLSADDTWSAKLGTLVGGAVYNAGKGGAGIKDYIHIARYMTNKIKPEVLIVAIYEGNDLRGYVNEIPTEPKNDAGTKKRILSGKIYYWLVYKSFLGFHSYAANTLAQVFVFVRHSSNQKKSARSTDSSSNFKYSVELDGQPIAMNVFNLDLDELMRAHQLKGGALSPEVWGPGLDDFAKIAKANKAKGIIAYIPSAYMAYWPVHFEDPGNDDLMMNAHKAQVEYLEKEVPARGMVFVDTTPVLQKASKTEKKLLYFPGNVHLTEAGHEAVAQAIGPPLEESLK